MRRRDMLFGLSALPLAGCAGTPIAPSPLSQSIQVPPVRVSRDRILKTVVGLRPYRSGGFRLSAEPFLGKTLIHNYGHGGDGVSLSWGCAGLAADYAVAAGHKDVAVIGAGVMGLTTALILSRKGHAVTLYAEDFPPHTTSNIAGALILTHPDYGHSLDDPIAAQLEAINRRAQAGFLPYVGKPGYGVKRITHYYLGAEQTDGRTVLGRRIRSHATKTMVDPGLYLQAIFEDARAAGTVAYSRRFENAVELTNLRQKTIVNCTGLGAGDLFGDENVRPVRGQLTLLKPQAEIDYSYIVRGAGASLYMFPRETAIVLGGTHERRVWDKTINQDTVERMLVQHGRMAMHGRVLV